MMDKLLQEYQGSMVSIVFRSNHLLTGRLEYNSIFDLYFLDVDTIEKPIVYFNVSAIDFIHKED